MAKTKKTTITLSLSLRRYYPTTRIWASGASRINTRIGGNSQNQGQNYTSTGFFLSSSSLSGVSAPDELSLSCLSCLISSRIVLRSISLSAENSQQPEFMAQWVRRHFFWTHQETPPIKALTKVPSKTQSVGSAKVFSSSELICLCFSQELVPQTMKR